MPNKIPDKWKRVRRAAFEVLLICLALGLLGLLFEKIGKRNSQEMTRMRHDAIAIQIADIKSGKNDCLVNPAPEFIEEIVADPVCREKIATVYLSYEVSDSRLGRLRELPNLKSVVFLWANDSDALLEHLRGMESIEALCFERCMVSTEGSECLSSFPRLKSLCMIMPKNSDGFEKLPAVENLVLTRVAFDERLIPALQSMPHLRQLTLCRYDFSDKEAEDYLKSLRKALPDCQCTAKCEER